MSKKRLRRLRRYVLLFILFSNTLISYSQTFITNIAKDTIKLDRYAYIDLINTLNSNLIAYADSGDYNFVNHLLEYGANPNFETEEGVTPLMYAVDNGYYDIAKLLIESGADVNKKPWDGNSAIFAAVRSNNDSIAELLINSNASINEKNNLNITPLHYSAGFGYPYMTNLIILNGAKVNERDQFGNTPLMAATYSGAPNVTTLLIESGADVNISDNHGNTPIMIATQFNDTLLIQKLISAGAEINAQNDNQINSLTIAIENNAIDAFKKLVKHGARTDLSPKNRGYYQFAKEKGCIEIANFLADEGLKTNLKLNINRINFYSGISTSKNDFMLDFGGGIQESVSNLLINFGFKYRPHSNRVQVFKDNTFYQFWEKRYSFYLSMQYLMMLKRNPVKGDMGFIPGISNELTWRYYRGMEEGSGVKYIPVPSIGLFYQRKLFTVIGKWEFVNYYKQLNSSNRFNLQLIVSIPTTKRYINKKIKWLD